MPQNQLKAYLERENLSPSQFGLICGVCKKVVYFCLNGIKIGPRTSAKIYLATRGEINFNIPYKRIPKKKTGPKGLRRRRTNANPNPETN